MSIHDGHRDRMRKRIEKDRMESLAPHEVLEVILYYCIPRVDTNGIAHALLKRFKKISKVLEADPRELQEIEGIGDYAAGFLNILNQFVRVVNIERETTDISSAMNTKEDYIQYMISLFTGLTHEASYILCLDGKKMPISHHKISEGDVVSVTISNRKIAEIAMKTNAVYIVLAHNHPHGLTVPSDDDYAATKALYLLLRGINVQLLDHVIVSDKNYVLISPDNLRRY